MDEKFMLIAVYSFVLGAIIEALTEYVKMIIEMFKKDKDIKEDKDMQSEDSILLNLKKQIKWYNVIIPIIIGIFVASVFDKTIFYYLPFSPINYYFEVAFTAVLLTRTANGAHGGYQVVATFFKSLIGRIIK